MDIRLRADVDSLSGNDEFKSAIWNKNLKVAQKIAMAKLDDIDRVNNVMDAYLRREKIL